jgi:transcriptional regulator with XRE-family HTH domain
MPSMGERLKRARKYKKVTIDELIDEMQKRYHFNVNKGMVSKWENDKVKPRAKALTTLSKTLEVPLNYIIGFPSVANIIIDLRLKTGLSIIQISEISKIPLERLISFESGLELPREDELTGLNIALGIDNLLNYAMSLGIEEKYITNKSTQIEEKKIIQYKVNKINRNYHRGTPHELRDVYTQLESHEDLYFKQRLLSVNERKKIIKLIEILLEDVKE